MYEKIDQCPICKAKSFDNHIICKDHSVSGESFALSKCQECEFVFTNPRPEKSVIQNYYDSADYISHTDKATNLTNIIYKQVRNITLNQKLSLINRLTKSRTILDYGCGTGEFLNHCQTNGWEVRGVEPNGQARQISIDKNGECAVEKIEDLEKEIRYDVITLWHVLEHVHNLNKVLKKLEAKMTKKSHLVIALPNNHSFDQNLYQADWAAYDVPRHLYHFNQLTFNILANKHGLKLIETLPMKFDAYYVSLLSEKYKTGKSNFLRAFINGWKSNIWASKHNNNYSSLIYVLKKK